jgi:hypothetical protein
LEGNTNLNNGHFSLNKLAIAGEPSPSGDSLRGDQRVPWSSELITGSGTKMTGNQPAITMNQIFIYYTNSKSNAHKEVHTGGSFDG